MRKPLVDAMAEAAFALETVAHLQGRERQLLPISEELREWIAYIKATNNLQEAMREFNHSIRGGDEHASATPPPPGKI